VAPLCIRLAGRLLLRVTCPFLGQNIETGPASQECRTEPAREAARKAHVLHVFRLHAYMRKVESRGLRAFRRTVRLRPILMTAVATLMAAVPSALGLGPGSETRGPMADAVVGGLILSTALSLLVVPAFYVVADRLRSARAQRRLHGTRHRGRELTRLARTRSDHRPMSRSAVSRATRWPRWSRIRATVLPRDVCKDGFVLTRTKRSPSDTAV